MLVGDCAIENATDDRELIFPCSNGIIHDYDTMESIWKYVFDHLEVDLSNTNVMVSSLPLEKLQDDTVTQIMFETFGIAAIDVVLEPTLVLYSHGCTSGTVFHMGHGTSYIAPVYNGYCIRNAIQYCPISGEDITKILASFVEQKVFEGKRMINDEEFYPFCGLDEMKKKVSYVTENYNTESLTSSIKYYDLELEYNDLRDRKKFHIGLGKERFQCCESIFNPSVCGYSGQGVQNMILDSVTTYPSKYHDIFSNVYVSGGSTMTHGFIKRFEKELSGLNSLRFEVFASERRDIAAWVGGSVLGCLNSHYKSWWTREEYIESGNRMWSMKYDVDLGTGDLMDTLNDESMIPFLLKGPTSLESFGKSILKKDVKKYEDKNIKTVESPEKLGRNDMYVDQEDGNQEIKPFHVDANVNDQEKDEKLNSESENLTTPVGTPEKTEISEVESPNKKKETKLPDNCARCSSSFYIFIRRRHICRNCNRVVCDNCSPGRQILEGCGPKPARVCLDCFPSQT